VPKKAFPFQIAGSEYVGHIIAYCSFVVLMKRTQKMLKVVKFIVCVHILTLGDSQGICSFRYLALKQCRH
jgi:hypothetical protein